MIPLIWLACVALGVLIVHDGERLLQIFIQTWYSRQSQANSGIRGIIQIEFEHQSQHTVPRSCTASRDYLHHCGDWRGWKYVWLALLQPELWPFQKCKLYESQLLNQPSSLSSFLCSSPGVLSCSDVLESLWLKNSKQVCCIGWYLVECVNLQLSAKFTHRRYAELEASDSCPSLNCFRWRVIKVVLSLYSCWLWCVLVAMSFVILLKSSHQFCPPGSATQRQATHSRS